MEEGRLVKWAKQEGDPVKSGDTLAEVETDKAIMELVARAEGQLIKVLVGAGETVPVGNVVAYIGKPGESVDGEGERAGAPPPPPPPSPSAAAEKPEPQARARAAAAAPAAPDVSPREPGRVKATECAVIE